MSPEKYKEQVDSAMSGLAIAALVIVVWIAIIIGSAS